MNKNNIRLPPDHYWILVDTGHVVCKKQNKTKLILLLVTRIRKPISARIQRLFGWTFLPAGRHRKHRGPAMPAPVRRILAGKQ